MPADLHRAAGVDDVGDVAVAVVILGGEDRVARAAEYLRRVVAVEQHRADRILAHRPDAVGQHQPAFVEQDRCAAIADLDELPRIFGAHQQLAAVPCI